MVSDSGQSWGHTDGLSQFSTPVHSVSSDLFKARREPVCVHCLSGPVLEGQISQQGLLK